MESGFQSYFDEFLLGVSSCFQTTFQVEVFSVTWRTVVTTRVRPSGPVFWENYLNFHFWSVNL